MADVAVLAAFLAGILLLSRLAARRRRRGLGDYYLAGRGLTLPLFVATLVPTFYGGVLGIGEFTWRFGVTNWLAMAAPYYLFAALYAALLAGRVRLAKGLTIPDHLEAAYGRPVALLAAGLVFLLACPADELLMVGTLLSHLTGLPPSWAMAACAALAWAVLRRGGLRADVWTNALQFAMMFGGFFLILPFAARSLPPEALPARLPPGHLSLGAGLSPWQLAGWWLIAVWTLVDPSFHQRCAAAESPAVARRGILVSVACWAVFDLMTTAAGLYSRALLPDLTQPLLAFPLLADKLLPPLARGLFYAGMCASILAALQGTALQACVSLGKDGLGRWRGADEAASERYSAAALPVALGLAWGLARLVPSVVGLWYGVGSAVIPGLLLPLLGAYYPAWRTPPRWALASSASGWAVSTAWLAWGQALGAPPLGLEPMFPGLALAAGLWLAGRAQRA